jgi:plasma kallikrein
MMAVMKKLNIGDKVTPGFIGGGALIHPRVVITAAHKVFEYERNPQNLLVRGGEWDTKTINEVCEHVDNDVAKVIIHEDYDHAVKNYRNSIALLVLKENFQLNSIINVGCLPPPGLKFDKQKCFGLGWGKTYFGSSAVYQNYLKKVELPAVNHGECEERLRASRLGPDFELHRGFMCAGGIPEQDTCTGDGGGPLNCLIEGHQDYFYIAGLVVAGVGCNNEFPAFYTDLSYYHDWIENQFIRERITTPKPFNDPRVKADPRSSSQFVIENLR